METQEVNDQAPTGSKTTIAPEVLLTIARLTTLDVPGVSRMGDTPGGANRLFNRRFGEGVRIDIQEDTVSAEIFVILKNNVNIRDVSRTIQQNVSRSITKMVGMNVGRINVHIEDIDYPGDTTDEQRSEA
jgi:uncharacterized alkaline shock family protein YloU